MKILYYTYFSTIFCKFNEKILGHFKICLLMEICLYMEILYYIFYSVESTRQNILCYEYQSLEQYIYIYIYIYVYIYIFRTQSLQEVGHDLLIERGQCYHSSPQRLPSEIECFIL